MSQATLAPAEPEDRLLNVEDAGKLLGGISKDVLHGPPALKALRRRIGGRVFFSGRRVQVFTRLSIPRKLPRPRWRPRQP